MIRVNELRIGNYILPRTGTEEYVKVTDIDEYGSIGTEAYFWDGAGSTGSTSEIARGIPLTPEWLERCGFVKGSSYIGIGYHWDGPNDISIVEQNIDKIDTFRLYGSEWTIGKDFKYLHQLQNLYFALTGEELQIKLP